MKLFIVVLRDEANHQLNEPHLPLTVNLTQIRSTCDSHITSGVETTGEDLLSLLQVPIPDYLPAASCRSSV